MPTLYWQDEDSGQTEIVVLDATTSETHEDILTVTDHPVEEGVNVADHARDEPTRLTVEGIVSNVPLFASDEEGSGYQSTELTVPTMPDPGNQTVELDVPSPPIQPSTTGLITAGVSALTSLVTGGPKATLRREPIERTTTVRASLLQFGTPKNRVREVYDKLLKAQKSRAFVTVQTAVREHFDMLLERVAVPRAVEDGSAARFQIDLKRIKVAAAETVQSPEPAEARGALGKKRGSQASKDDPNGAKKEELRSTLSELLF